MLEIDGARKPTLRQTIVRLLEPHVTMSAQAYRNAAKRLRAKKLTPRNIKRVSRYLEADGVVDGTIEPKGGRYNLIIRVRSGRTGLVVKKITLKLSKPNLTTAMQKQLKRRLNDGVSALSRGKRTKAVEIAESESIRDNEEISESAPRQQEKDRIKMRRARLEEKAASPDEDDQAEELGDEGDGREEDFIDLEAPKKEKVVVKNGNQKGPRSVFVYAGVGTLKRDLDFNFIQVGNPPAEPPVPFRGSFVPTFFAGGEFFPLALAGQTNFLAGFGVVGTYEKALSIRTTLNGEELPTSMDRIRIGGTYRHVFGDTNTSPSIALSASYNLQNFVIDKNAATSAVVEIPNVEYVYVDPGLAIRLPIGKLAFFADVRGILILDAGEIQEQSQYGAATITGVDGDAGFEFLLTSNLVLRLGARFARFGYSFQAEGTPANLADRDNDGQLDVSGATDTYLGGYGALGIQF